MLKIVIPEKEWFDEATQSFVKTKSQVLQLEHSLVSLSKWESKWHKPFLSKEEKTLEETIDYVRCMTITQNVDPNIYYALDQDSILAINKYIEDPMSATTFAKEDPTKAVKGGRGEQITSELIYYWMIALNIPPKFETWHINRLLTLIKVCNIKNTPPKKMNRGEIMKRNAAINAARRKKLHTRG